jgi:Family of unknown function (DUF5994)
VCDRSGHVVADSIRGQHGSVAMTLERASNRFTRDGTPGIRTPRFRLKSRAQCGVGYVDGAWWPRIDYLMTELPDLLGALSLRLRAINRVRYDLSEWTATPAELTYGGKRVRLDGRHRPTNTLEVLDADGNKVALLVVPIRTDPDRAHAIVLAAAASDNVSSVDTLLMISREDREIRSERAAARERWDSQGEATSRRLTSGDTALKAFSDFVIDGIPAEAPVARRTLRRLEDADNSISPVRALRMSAPPWHPASWSN